MILLIRDKSIINPLPNNFLIVQQRVRNLCKQIATDQISFQFRFTHGMIYLG